jgi:hypothetical protein
MTWLLVALLAVAAVGAGWRGAPVAAVAAATLAAAWLAAAVLFAGDYRDADGFMDCWPSCTAVQDTVGFAIFVLPAMFVLVLLGSLAGWMARRGRR